MELPILQDIIVILGLSVILILVFQRIRLPVVFGFLLTGIIAGPYGLNLIEASHEVELLSEIGIIFLLFIIGIEFSLKGFSSIRNTVLWGGLLQVGGTIGIASLCSYLLGLSLQSAVFMGFLLSLSSTAIVLKMLQEKGQITAPHGRISVAILIFQDIVVVPMILVTPLLAGVSDDLLNTVILLIAKVIGIIGIVIILTRYIVPVILRLVVRSKSRELFILTVVVLCFATAWLTSSFGLSLALGAFFAGLIISDSDYSHQATANILPFREIFMSFFFVSVGMLLNLEFFIGNVLTVLLLTIGVILVKILVTALTVYILRYPARTIFITAFSLFQVGEFALLLLATGMEYDLLSESVYQYFLAISIISMAVSPFLIEYAPRISEVLIRVPLPKQVKARLASVNQSKNQTLSKEDNYHDHLVIIGYGINGENVANAARKADIPYVIIELDPDALQKAKEKSEPVIFGDAADDMILKYVHIHEARVVVIAISDPYATHKIVRRIREFTQTAYIIVRTRYIREIDENLKLGADEVIPEEFETSIEIFTRVLKKYLVPTDEIRNFINHIRARNYEMLREIPAIKDATPYQLNIPDIEIATLPVQQGNNKIVGKTIHESRIRNKYGITVLAIQRDKKYITDITPETAIRQDDILYVIGTPNSIARANEFFKIG